MICKVSFKPNYSIIRQPFKSSYPTKCYILFSNRFSPDLKSYLESSLKIKEKKKFFTILEPQSKLDIGFGTVVLGIQEIEILIREFSFSSTIH